MLAGWHLLQAGSRPLCAAHLLDLGLWGSLHDALLIWCEPGSGAALPQFPHREGCCAVSAGSGSSRGGGSLETHGVGQDGRVHMHPLDPGSRPPFWKLRRTCLTVPINPTFPLDADFLQLLLCCVPLPAAGPLHELPHRPGHVRLLSGVSHEYPAVSGSS